MKFGMLIIDPILNISSFITSLRDIIIRKFDYVCAIKIAETVILDIFGEI